MAMSERGNVLTRFDADLISLRASVAIADSGSFSSAAKQIGRTQSAVSLQIAKLEERLGVRLLERTSRSVHATSEGETLIAYARHIISFADEAMCVVSSQTNQKPLCLGIDDVHNRDGILTCLQQFSRDEPLTPLRFHFDQIDALQAAMQGDELDLIIGHDLLGQPLSESHLEYKRTLLLGEPLVWAACNERLRSQRPLPIVLPQASSAIRQATLDTLNTAGIRWNITAECNSVPALQSAVRAGLGIAALPLSALGEGIVEANEGLPNLPASALFVDVLANGGHPDAGALVEQLKTPCKVSLSGASTDQSRSSAETEHLTDKAPLSTA